MPAYSGMTVFKYRTGKMSRQAGKMSCKTGKMSRQAGKMSRQAGKMSCQRRLASTVLKVKHF